MPDRQAHWEDVYTTKRESEVSWFQDEPRISLELLKAAGVTRESAIIDIGGGASRLVDILLADGCSAVSVLDLSEAALATARHRIGPDAQRATWIAADVTTWAPTHQYDVWHDRAAFHFLTANEDRIAYVERLRSALRAGGQVIIGTFALDGPEKCSGLPVRRYDAVTLHSTLGTDFRILETRREIHATPWGTPQSFQFTRLQRAPA